MKQTSAIITDIYPIIEKGLSKHLTSYRKNIQLFFQRRAKSIYDVAPYDRMYYGEEDRNEFFRSIQVNKRDITKGLTNTYYWGIQSFNPRAAKDELTIAVMMCIRYFILHHK